MTGGIFKNKPFVFNPKCIVFSFYSSLLFAAGGGKNPLILALIFIMAYVLLAWYDFTYGCEDLMYSGTGPGFNPSPIFKPQYRKKDRDADKDTDEKQLVFDQEQAYLQKVYFFHALLVAPLLMYVGYYGASSNDKVWGLMGGMGGVAFLYHSLRLKYPRDVWG
jgi:hypothetical protein